MARISLAERLCIASNAFIARISNALLPPLANGVEAKLSLSAGLPHFAEGKIILLTFRTYHLKVFGAIGAATHSLRCPAFFF